MSEPFSIFNYSVLSKFNKNVFGNLITINELKSEHEEMYSKNQGIDEYYGYYFLVPAEKRLYFFDAVDKKTNQNILDCLPVSIEDSSKTFYKNKVFYHVNSYKSFKIIPKKVLTYREIVDKLSSIGHTNPEHYKLYVHHILPSILDKVFLRISSNKGFGKDSLVRVLGLLLNGVTVFQPRTIAKLERVLGYTKLLCCNEMGTLSDDQKKLIESFILQVCDYSPTYEKGSMAMKGMSKDTNDTENLSAVFLYNDRDHYKDEKAFFDYIFNNEAVYDRLYQAKFSGRLDTMQFHNNFDIDKVAMEQQQTFIDLLKSLEYYKKFYRMELKPFKLRKTYPLTERHMKVFMKLVEFVNLYANTEEEFNQIVDKMYERHTAYKDMLKEEANPYSDFIKRDEDRPVVVKRWKVLPDFTEVELVKGLCQTCKKETEVYRYGGDMICNSCGEIVKEI